MVTNIGVQTTTSTRSGPSNAGVSQGRFHVAGLTEKGSTTAPSVVRSLGDYVSLLGGRTAYSNALYDTARTFFEEGGSELVVSRVVGPNATKGNLTLADGTAVPTLVIEAIDPGAHAAGFSAEVTVEAGTYTLSLYVGAERVARYAALTSPAAAVAAASANPFVRIRDLGSSTTAPGNNPAALAKTALTSGSDDRAAITTAHIMAALDGADKVAQGGTVAVPGYSAEVIGVALLAHAARSRKIALLAMDSDTTVTEATTYAKTLNTGPDGAYGGLFYPHLIIPDGTGSRTVSPEGYVAAVRARGFLTDGFWQVPAGDRARARWVMGTNVPVSTETNNTLAAGLVNGITTTGNRVRLYNWSSLALDRENLALLSSRDVLNNLAIITEATLESYVFATIDGRGHLLGFIRAAIIGVLEPVARRGGFYAALNDDGEEVDPGYAVVVDRTNNPTQSLADNTVVVSISVRLSPTAALIEAEIIKVPLTASV